MEFTLEERNGYKLRERSIITCTSIEDAELKTIPLLLLENMCACIIETNEAYYVIKNSTDETIKELGEIKGEMHVPLNIFINDIEDIKLIIGNDTILSEDEIWNRVKKLFSKFAFYYNTVVYISCDNNLLLEDYFPEIYNFHIKAISSLSIISKITKKEIYKRFDLNRENGMTYILFKESLKEIIENM